MVARFNPLVIGSIFQTPVCNFSMATEESWKFQSPSNRVNIPNADYAFVDRDHEEKFQSPSNRVNIPNILS